MPNDYYFPSWIHRNSLTDDSGPTPLGHCYKWSLLRSLSTMCHAAPTPSGTNLLKVGRKNNYLHKVCESKNVIKTKRKMECIPSFFLLWLFTSCAFTHFLLIFPQHFALHHNTGSVAPVWKNLASVYGRVLEIHCLTYNVLCFGGTQRTCGGIALDANCVFFYSLIARQRKKNTSETTGRNFF